MNPAECSVINLIRSSVEVGATYRFFQRALRSPLNHRPVGHRVGERDAEFDHVRSRIGQREQQAFGRRQVWIARGDVRDEGFATFSPQLFKFCGDASHIFESGRARERESEGSRERDISFLVSCYPALPLSRSLALTSSPCTSLSRLSSRRRRPPARIRRESSSRRPAAPTPPGPTHRGPSR